MANDVVMANDEASCDAGYYLGCNPGILAQGIQSEANAIKGIENFLIDADTGVRQNRGILPSSNTVETMILP
ncbi:MAG: hypothetical protein ACFBSC_06310 [Microcoleaceae cyanobacterium]